MSKHTPGPWAVEKSLEQKHGTRVVAIAPVAWCGTNSVFGVDGNQSISAKQARANAHLIAAAPDNYESNVELNAIVRELCLYYGHPYPQEALGRSDAAIAKTRGEIK